MGWEQLFIFTIIIFGFKKLSERIKTIINCCYCCWRPHHVVSMLHGSRPQIRDLEMCVYFGIMGPKWPSQHGGGLLHIYSHIVSKSSYPQKWGPDSIINWSSSSCDQTLFPHGSTHCFPTSLNEIMSIMSKSGDVHVGNTVIFVP